MTTKTGILLIAVGIATFVSIILVILCFKMVVTPQDGYLNLAIVLASVSLGCLLGTFISPESGSEQSRFSVYGKAVSAFVSGYLVSKLDKVVEMILSPQTLAVPIASFRLAASISAVISALLVTYIVRAYVYKGNPD
ncbi:MAG TPA: hypothetical protein VGY75_12385 [Candidatus Udaeobacter sp.]|jgi:hypothetical protein|nr:hypothetical protein [Candidatus Udaeobacter sp.]